MYVLVYFRKSYWASLNILYLAFRVVLALLVPGLLLSTLGTMLDLGLGVWMLIL